MRPGPRPSPAEGLTLAEQVGQTVILRFNGTRVPASARRALRQGRAAGVILFTDNVASRGQLRRLTRTLQAAAGGGALVATDQEGGPVRRLPFAGPDPAPALQATPADAEAAARDAGRELHAIGVNTTLAPVADVPVSPEAVIRPRAFPGSPTEVGAHVRAAIDAYHGQRVAATAKHFPGLGAARQNTDEAPARIDRSRSQMRRSELEPFRAAISEDAPLIMAAHASYPAYDGDRIASQSRPILTGLLRERLGYRGVVITDSLEAEASLAASGGSVSTAALRSIRAGADLALTTGSASHGVVFSRLISRARRSPKLRAKIERSADRVLALKRELGLPPPGP